jgi:hypothetical protein
MAVGHWPTQELPLRVVLTGSPSLRRITGICAIVVSHGSNPKQSLAKRVLILDCFDDPTDLSN